MARAIHLPMGPEEGMRELLRALLRSGKVQGVFTLMRVEAGRMAYALVADPERLEEAEPLYPLMPTNLGQVLNRFTMKGASPRPIAVVARPCELRAFAEMVKRRQGRMENLIFISHTCGGVFPLEASIEGTLEEKLPEYWEAAEGGRVHPDLRPACQSCVEFVPYLADVTLKVVDGGGGCALLAKGGAGERLMEGLPWAVTEDELDQGRLSRMRQRRSEAREMWFAKDASGHGLQGLVATFGRCIGCHACSKACPICACNLCAFESSLLDRTSADYDRELMAKKGIRLPPGTTYFHLGRMVHMAVSCVACGSCQDVCPVHIPVSMVFKRVGESLQRVFDYLPGKELDQPLPVTAFEVEEFMEIEGKGRG